MSESSFLLSKFLNVWKFTMVSIRKRTQYDILIKKSFFCLLLRCNTRVSKKIPSNIIITQNRNKI